MEKTWLIVVVLLGMLASCDSAFLHGKDCDEKDACLGGYVCDLSRHVCVWPNEIVGGQTGGDELDGGAVGGDGGGVFDCDELATGGYRVRQVSLNGQGAYVEVDPGEDINVAMDYLATQVTGCDECMYQLVAGLWAEGYGHQEWHCFDLAKPPICPQIVSGRLVFSGRAPPTPGEYELWVTLAGEVNCLHASEQYAQWASRGESVARIKVREPVCEPWQLYLQDVRLNEGGPEATVEVGEELSFSARYFAAQMEGCPDCLDQIVIGIGNQAQICTDLGVINSCPEGVSGSITGTLQAPAQAGSYAIKTAMIAHWDCDGARDTYRDNPPDSEWTIGILHVQDD